MNYPVYVNYGEDQIIYIFSTPNRAKKFEENYLNNRKQRLENYRKRRIVFANNELFDIMFYLTVQYKSFHIIYNNIDIYNPMDITFMNGGVKIK